MDKRFPEFCKGGDVDAARRTVMAEFSGTSDRAAVITSAALLEELLAGLLRRFMVTNTEREDRLFDGANAPIGTFSAKIEVAYRSGLISERERKLLHFVRGIRNDFAHSWDEASFHVPSVRDRCRNFALPVDVVRPRLPEGKVLSEAVPIDKATPDDPRSLFREVVGFLVDALVARSFSIYESERKSLAEFVDYGEMLDVPRQTLQGSLDRLIASRPERYEAAGNEVVRVLRRAIEMQAGAVTAARASLSKWREEHKA
jgi:hypothetical protein